MGTVMDVGIVAVQVAQARLETEGLLLEDKESVRAYLGQGVGHTKLKRHVESRHLEVSRKGDSAEVVDRGTAACNEGEDSFQAAPATSGHFQDATRSPAEPSQACNEGDEEGIVLRIKGNIEKDALTVYLVHRAGREHSWLAVYFGYLFSLGGGVPPIGAGLTGSQRGSVGGSIGRPLARSLSTISTSFGVTPRVRLICSAVAGGAMCFAMSEL